MSDLELQRFINAIQDRPALAEEFVTASAPAELAGLIRAAGYDVTDDEVVAAFRTDPDLSDEQLDAVAGGYRLGDRFPLFRPR